jgi:hypothetical protein
VFAIIQLLRIALMAVEVCEIRVLHLGPQLEGSKLESVLLIVFGQRQLLLQACEGWWVGGLQDI